MAVESADRIALVTTFEPAMAFSRILRSESFLMTLGRNGSDR